MCCGQKRSLLNNTAAISRPPSMPPQVGANGRHLSSLTPTVNVNNIADRAASGRAVQVNAHSVVHDATQGGTPSPISPGPREIAVRYLKAAPVRARGLITGRSYEFSGTQSLANVDARDVPALLNTGLFARN
jgi:hypothetical protein